MKNTQGTIELTQVVYMKLGIGISIESAISSAKQITSKEIKTHFSLISGSIY